MARRFPLARRTLAVAALLAALPSLPALAQPSTVPSTAPGMQEPQPPPGAPVPVTKSLKIGFIGAGRIGGAFAQLFAQAGYAVMISARDLGQIKSEAARIGYGIQAGTADQAAAFGDIVIISVPYNQLKVVARDQGAALKGKIIVDTNNPKNQDYYDLTPQERELGSGVGDQLMFPGTRLVKGFDTVSSGLVIKSAHRTGEPAGVPLAADDNQALATVARLVRDIGYEPVTAGGLASAAIFDSYTPFHPNDATALSASQVRQMLIDKPARIPVAEVRRLHQVPGDQMPPEDQAKIAAYQKCCSF